jgi:dUTP pyrophosphatase
MIDVKVKKLTDTAKMPTRAYDGDAGWDLYVDSNHIFDDDKPTPKMLCKFGIALEIPKGYVGLIFPRSSIYKTSLRLSNCVGVIDSGYRGEIKAVFDFIDSEHGISWLVSGRAAQIVFMKLPDVQLIQADELSKSQRGEGGYGSSGDVLNGEEQRIDWGVPGE